ncbi:MAG: hypothetical protein ABIA75_13560 [Candidatus Neomarinimicrobiota bacterium]
MDQKDTNDLMSTLGLKKDGDQPDAADTPEKKEPSVVDELARFNIDKAEADSPTAGPESADLSDVPETTAADSDRDKDDPAESPEAAENIDKGPSDSSYLIDSDFADFTVDENVISNYRSTLIERQAELAAEAADAPETPTPARTESQPPFDQPSSDTPAATFFMVDLYRQQGMLRQALKVLDTLENLDLDPERIFRERNEILVELGEEPVERTDVLPAEPVVEPELPGEQPVVSEPDEETPAAAAPEISEEDYERHRVDMLKKRMGVATDDGAPAEPMAESVPVTEDEHEQHRIEALQRRMGAREKTPEPELVEEPAIEEPDLAPSPATAVEGEDEQDLLRIARIREQAQQPASVVTPPPAATAGGDGTGSKKLPLKWLYGSMAFILVVVAILVFWPESGPPPVYEPPDRAITGTGQPAVTAAEAVPVAIPDTTEKVVAVDTAQVKVIVVPPQPVEKTPAKTEKAVPPKPQPAVKTLPLRNLKTNKEAVEKFKQGNYWAAAEVWGKEKKQQPGNYTIILLFGCENKTIRNAYSTLGSPADFFLLPRYIGDRQCYTICWGDFKSLADAKKWFGEVPKWFYDNGAKPMIRSFGQIKITTQVKVAKAVVATPPVAEKAAVPEPVVESNTALAAAIEAEEIKIELTAAEEVFVQAMITLQETLPAEDSLEAGTMNLPEYATEEETGPVGQDTLVVLTTADHADDWIEMDTVSQQLEPLAEDAGIDFIEITELEEAAPVAPEPEPDYSARELLELERYPEAAAKWRLEKGGRGSSYTVKLLTACQDVSVGDAYGAVNRSAEFFILPNKVQGQDCYALCWGEFESKKKAKARLKEVPKWFQRNGGKPVVTTIAEVGK